MFCADTNFKWGSPEMKAANARLAELGQKGCATSLLAGLLTRAGSNHFAIMAACCWVRTVGEHEARYFSFEEKHGRELAEMFMENVRENGQCAPLHLCFTPAFPFPLILACCSPYTDTCAASPSPT